MEVLGRLQRRDMIQFERMGNFRVDQPLLKDKPVVIFEISTGKTK